MTSCGSLPTGIFAVACSVDGSTMLSVWSCFDSTSREAVALWPWRAPGTQSAVKMERIATKRTGILMAKDTSEYQPGMDWIDGTMGRGVQCVSRKGEPVAHGRLADSLTCGITQPPICTMLR